MSDAVRIEQRLSDLIAGRHKRGPQHHNRQSPREMERLAMERLYGERSKTVTRVEQTSQN
jgi:hypothetical protein